MSDWRLDIPHRSRNDAIADAMDAARSLPPEARDVTRAALVELATEHNAHTVGEALDQLDRATPEARRGLLDRARQEVGLPTTGDADSQAEHEARQKTIAPPSGPMRAPNGFLLSPLCAAKDCMTVPRERTKAKRWWCLEHRAGHESDMLAYEGPRLAYGPSGTVIDLDQRDAEQQRARAAEASQKAQRKERETEQRAAAEQAAADRRARDEQLDRELPDEFFAR